MGSWEKTERGLAHDETPPPVNVKARKPNQNAASAVRFLPALALISLGLLVGCSTQTRHTWLTVFFDGVPVAGATNPPPMSLDDEGRPWTPPVTVAAANLVGAPVPQFNSHAPYEKQECSKCHESKFSVAMRAPQKQVCLECHEPVKRVMTNAKSVHQPADNGECTACHKPHGSEFKKLLSKPGNAPCWECHDNFLEKARFKHQPVESGSCSECHDPHATNFKGLLKKPDPQTCFECHEPANMAKAAGHRGADLSTCSKCHDPHAGADKYFLKPGVAPPRP